MNKHKPDFKNISGKDSNKIQTEEQLQLHR